MCYNGGGYAYHDGTFHSVVVYEFYISGTGLCPGETNAILFVDANAVLPPPVAFQCHQAIG